MLSYSPFGAEGETDAARVWLRATSCPSTRASPPSAGRAVQQNPDGGRLAGRRWVPGSRNVAGAHRKTQILQHLPLAQGLADALKLYG
jgi:hypothetical protein